MLCKACNKPTNFKESEDCFETALDAIKQHYLYYKNTLEHRELALKQVKERNETLNKALELLQTSQQPNKRFKPSSQQHCSEAWLPNHDSINGERTNSDLSLTDDEPVAVTNLNMAINSEQLFETSALSPGNNDASITSSEFVISPRHKESPKRNRQRDMRRLKDVQNKTLEKSKSEWHTKERNSPVEKSWAAKFLKPTATTSTITTTNTKAMESKTASDLKKSEKRLCLSLKKNNPSKMKQSLIQFNQAKNGNPNESDVSEDIIESSPVVTGKNSKAGRSWAHRSGNNLSLNNNCSSNNNSTNVSPNATHNQGDNEIIVFDFSPTKKAEDTLEDKSHKNPQGKELKFDNDISMDCISLPHDHVAVNTTDKSDSSSVMILTPNTEDIIFVDDTCNDELDTMALLADIMKPNNTENLKKYESKTIQKPEVPQFKKPQTKSVTDFFIKPSTNIKQEKTTQKLDSSTKLKENIKALTASTSKPQNPLFSSDDQEYDEEEEEEDSMPKPFIVKQEPNVSKTSKTLTFKERFNIDCDYCENYVKILGANLTDCQIREHINKCTRHTNGEVLRQNTPKDFWNPFILSFQEDDPRNEVLVDTRFKDRRNLE